MAGKEVRMDFYPHDKNTNKNNGSACSTSGSRKQEDYEMKSGPSMENSYGYDKTDDEIIDDMESGEYDS